MRAYCYFDMLQKWGDLPIVTEAFPDNEEILVAANKRQLATRWLVSSWKTWTRLSR